MKATKYALVIALALIALVAPRAARADDIVQVTVSNLTFNGNNTCGPSGTTLCTQTLSASFQWDNSNNTYVAGSDTFTTAGDLGTSFSLPAGVPKFEPSFQGVLWVITTPLPAQYATLGVNLGELTGPFTGPLQPLVTGLYSPDNVTGLFPSAVGTYEAYVSCNGAYVQCSSEGWAPPSPEAFSTGGTVSVEPVATAAAEPSSVLLLGMGLLGLMGLGLYKKRLA